MDGKGGATRAAARAARMLQRRERMRQRLAAAATAEARLNSAFDWFRSSAGALAKNGASRTGLTPNRPAAERAMNVAADYLADLAEAIDGGHA